MLCVIPFFAGDKDQAVRLAHWIRDLGGVKNHDCLLVVDESTTAGGVYEPLAEAFKSVTVTASKPAGDQGTWGNGTTDATAANEMFLTGATYVYHKLKVPFFWLEPDAAPDRSTWLDEIEAEYKACGKPFMGMRVDMPPHEIHMSGIGCYPFDVANHSVAMMMPGKNAWDYAGRKDTVGKGKAHFTKLIQHVYRINGNVPEWPTFPTLESLSQINPEAAVFHRCKDETLIQQLKNRHFGVRGLNVGEVIKIDGVCVSQDPQEAGARDAIAQAPTEGSNPSAPAVNHLIDLRGFNAEGMALKLGEARAPIRLNSTTFGTPEWHAARYEIRKVESSEIPGINAGDSVLFSRVAPAVELKQSPSKKSHSERMKEAWAKRKAKEAKAAERKAKKLTEVL